VANPGRPSSAPMERLWSPWRMEYVRSAGRPENDQGCIFCDKPKASDDAAAYILARSDTAFALLNAYPYNPGHLMVAPFRHTGDLVTLEERELVDSDALILRSIAVLREASAPAGFNLGMNLGRTAGAGVVDHLHWHVVPRWEGDTNFMAVVGETRVLPELLTESYAKLKPLFDRSSP
jgi:ATP adenylyltransferase